MPSVAYAQHYHHYHGGGGYYGHGGGWGWGGFAAGAAAGAILGGIAANQGYCITGRGLMPMSPGRSTSGRCPAIVVAADAGSAPTRTAATAITARATDLPPHVRNSCDDNRTTREAASVGGLFCYFELQA